MTTSKQRIVSLVSLVGYINIISELTGASIQFTFVLLSGLAVKLIQVPLNNRL